MDGAIFVTLSDESAIAVIDVVILKVVKVIPVQPCVATHGLAYDSANEVLFVGCNEGSTADVNVVAGNVIGRSPTSPGIGTSRSINMTEHCSCHAAKARFA